MKISEWIDLNLDDVLYRVWGVMAIVMAIFAIFAVTIFAVVLIKWACKTSVFNDSNESRNKCLGNLKTPVQLQVTIDGKTHMIIVPDSQIIPTKETESNP